MPSCLGPKACGKATSTIEKSQRKWLKRGNCGYAAYRRHIFRPVLRHPTSPDAIGTKRADRQRCRHVKPRNVAVQDTLINGDDAGCRRPGGAAASEDIDLLTRTIGHDTI